MKVIISLDFIREKRSSKSGLESKKRKKTEIEIDREVLELNMRGKKYKSKVR